jgi:hypothetical protein
MRIKKWLLASIQLQLYLTLMSSPILAYWGLPISLVSPVGNILFQPLLTAFLFLSSLIFFCQMLHIPHGICNSALNYTSQLFHYLLKLGSPSWLVGIPQPPLWLLIALPCSACLIMSCKKTRTPLRSIICLLGISGLTGCYMHFTQQPHTIIEIPCNTKQVYLVNTDNNTLLIDPGALGTIANPESWIEFTLMPALIKNTGHTTVDKILILQPSQRTFQAITCCLSSATQQLYMPFWNGDMKPSQKRSYAQLMKTVEQNKVTLTRFGKECTLKLSSTSLHIKALNEKIRNNGLTYPAYSVTGTLQNNEINIVSCKARKNA